MAKRIGWQAIGLALLALAACKAQPDATPANKAAQEKADANIAPKTLPGDEELAKQLAGDWVTSEKRPTGNAKDICATDAGISLDRDGGYASLDEFGTWAVKGGVLVVTATASLDDSDSEGEGEAREVPIKPPRITKWPIEKIEGDIAVMRFEGGQFWMFRCPPASP